MTYYGGAKGMYVTSAQWPTVFPLLIAGEQGGFIYQARGNEQIVKAYTSLMMHGHGNYWNDCMQFGIYNNAGWETEPYTNCTGTGPVAVERRGGTPGSPQNRFWFGTTINTTTPYDGWDSNFNAHMRDVEIWKYDGDYPYGPAGSAKPVVLNGSALVSDPNSAISARALDQSTGVASITFRGPASWSGNNKVITNPSCDRARCSTDFSASTPVTTTMPEGQQTIWVVAKDAAGNVAESERVTMNVDWPDPADDGRVGAGGQTGFFLNVAESLDDTTSVAVNVASGNLKVATEDLSPAAETGFLRVTRYYNSLGSDVSSGLGPRWSFDAARSVRLVVTQGGHVRVHGPDGHSVRFDRTSDGSYVRPSGYDGALTATASGWTLKQYDRAVELRFNSAGRLMQIVDVDDDADRTFTVSYASTGSGERLSGLRSGDGSTATFFQYPGPETDYLFDSAGGVRMYAYDGSRRLGWYMANDGSETSYGYDVNGYLSSISMPDGTAVSITSGGDGRVGQLEVEHSDGELSSTAFEYGPAGADCADGDVGQTTVTQTDGTEQTHCWTSDFRVRATADERALYDQEDEEPVGPDDPDPWGETIPFECPLDPEIPENTCGTDDVPNESAGTVSALAPGPNLAREDYGISDNNRRSVIHERRWKELNVVWLRRVVSWNLALLDPESDEFKHEREFILDALNQRNARGERVKVLVSFERCRGTFVRDGQSLPCATDRDAGVIGVPPTLHEYAKAVEAFLTYDDERDDDKYPLDLKDVEHFTAWNEPNHKEYTPVWDRPRLAARYFLKLNGLCASSRQNCQVAAGDFLDLQMPWPQKPSTYGGDYLARYKDELGGKRGSWVKRWAWHAYKDTMETYKSFPNQPEMWWRRFKDFAQATKYGDKNPDIWLTEQGVVRRWNKDRTTGEPNETYAMEAKPARAVMRALMDYGEQSLVEIDDRIKKFFYYQYKGEQSPNWDSGLLSPDGDVRRIYRIFKSKVN